MEPETNNAFWIDSVGGINGYWLVQSMENMELESPKQYGVDSLELRELRENRTQITQLSLKIKFIKGNL